MENQWPMGNQWPMENQLPPQTHKWLKMKKLYA
jgi:hypothetical protein